MKKFISGGSMDLGILLLRLATGILLFTAHGLGKLLSFDKRFHTFSDPIGVGHEISFMLVLVAEIVCPVLIILGLFTRFAAIPVIIMMAVAIFMVHFNGPWNKIELPLLFLIPAFVLLITGPGKYSFDYRLKNK